MIIPITIPRPNQYSAKLPPQLAQLGNDEIFLIELQGTLDVEGTEVAQKDGQLIGNLNTTNMVRHQHVGVQDLADAVHLQNKPTLIIGHHLLEGKVVNLPKPLGVLHKQSTDDTQGSTAWGVIAVVKKKLVFSKRPMPIAPKQSGAKPSSRRA